jgi:hypothetical protein
MARLPNAKSRTAHAPSDNQHPAALRIWLADLALAVGDATDGRDAVIAVASDGDTTVLSGLGARAEWPAARLQPRRLLSDEWERDGSGIDPTDVVDNVDLTILGSRARLPVSVVDGVREQADDPVDRGDGPATDGGVTADQGWAAWATAHDHVLVGALPCPACRWRWRDVTLGPSRLRSALSNGLIQRTERQSGSNVAVWAVDARLIRWLADRRGEWDCPICGEPVTAADGVDLTDAPDAAGDDEQQRLVTDGGQPDRVDPREPQRTSRSEHDDRCPDCGSARLSESAAGPRCLDCGTIVGGGRR